MIQKIYTLATVIRRVFLGIRLRSLEFLYDSEGKEKDKD